MYIIISSGIVFYFIASIATGYLRSNGVVEVCDPGDNIYCYYLGVCNSNGTACNCFDPTTRWSSDRCSTYHDGPMLLPGQVCAPGYKNSYCNYEGKCNSLGTGCICFNDHWWWTERCSTWHSTVQLNNFSLSNENSSGILKVTYRIFLYRMII